jgi:ATP-dependent DNA ligase
MLAPIGAVAKPSGGESGMMMAVRPGIEPMLARLARELPIGGYAYEPKWDGFRCLAFRDRDEVDLRSRHQRPLARYFPEVVAAIRSLPADPLVLDGELVVDGAAGLDFAALMGRLHPAASRVQRLAAEQPALFMAFDVLQAGGADLAARPFAQRRARLEALLAGARGRVRATPSTDDPALAAGWLERAPGRGIDGVVAKPLDAPYAPGVRALVKVKRERTADCVVAGMRGHAREPVVGSLLLGLYDPDGELVHVGVVSSFARARRRELVDELRGLAIPLQEHPWREGMLLGGGPMGRLRGAAGRWDPATMPLDWVPLRPERVAEVAYEQLDGHRFRHPARFRRWRPDRDPRSCATEQLDAP